jgi:hypothetical protein
MDKVHLSMPEKQTDTFGCNSLHIGQFEVSNNALRSANQMRQ